MFFPSSPILGVPGYITFEDAETSQFTFDPPKNDKLYHVSSDAGAGTVSMSGYYSKSANGQHSYVITSDTANQLVVHFLNSDRRTAKGKFNPQSLSGSVNFVDDREYQFTFNPISGVITWDNVENIWYRVSTTVSIDGYYSKFKNGQHSFVISSDKDNQLTVRFLLISQRPDAQGKFDPQTLSGSVNFADDREYQFTFNPTSGVITWDNVENLWYRVSTTVSMTQ